MFNNYLKLVKFSHTLFSLPFAIASFFLALRSGDHTLSWWLLILVILAVIFARNAAMAFNRYADREFDKANPRTQQREIPAGILPARRALIFIIVNSLLFMATAWLINPLCFILSPVALLVILGYSLTKRFTMLCHLILGMGLALAPLGAWLAVTEQFALTPVLIALAVLFWVAGFDIIYALQDEYFDRENMLRSIPARFGASKALWISAIIHLLCFGFLVGATLSFQPGITGWTGTAIFGTLLLYQHLIISPKDLSRVNLAFFTTNGIASILWAVMIVVQ